MSQPDRTPSAAPVCRRRHRWTVVEQRVEPSDLERLRKSGLTSVARFTEGMAQAHCFVHYRCADCGTEEVRRV